MTPRTLVLEDEAIADVAGRARDLRRARGDAFADAWIDDLLAWLDRHAALGAQIGTAHPTRPGLRTFAYKRQATLLVRYSEGEVRVVRVYCGQARNKDPVSGVIGFQKGPLWRRGSQCSRGNWEPRLGCWLWRRSPRSVGRTSFRESRSSRSVVS